MRNFAYAGYGDTHDSRYMESDYPPPQRGVLWSFFDLIYRLIIVVLFALILVGGVVILPLLMQPDKVPEFQQHTTAYLQKYVGLSSDEIEGMRAKVYMAVEDYLPAGLREKEKKKVQNKVVPVVNEYDEEFREQLAFISTIVNEHGPRQGQLEWVARLIVKESRLANVDPLLTTAVVFSSSSFNAEAESVEGEVGLMMLSADNGKYISKITGIPWRGEGALKHPKYNLQLGLRHMQFLDRVFDGNTRYVLLAQKLGVHRLIEAGREGKGLPPNVSAYADTVLKNYNTWKALM